jgi:two-component system, sensor histidine kinase and response regulator
MRKEGPRDPPSRAVVIIDPAGGGEIPSLREQGFNAYLVRPIRPLSLLTQLFGDLEEEPAQRAQGVSSAFPPLRAVATDGPKPLILLAEDDINA